MFRKFRLGMLAALAISMFACGGAGDNSAPTWPDGAQLEILALDATSVRLAWPAAEDDRAVTAYRLVRDGELETDLGASVQEHVVSGLIPSTTYAYQIQAGDEAGNWSVDGPSVEVTTESGLPPDPALVAPVVDLSSFESFYSRMSFLWQGDKPVVWGADPGAFEARRLVILRGRVLDEEEQPLSWVDVRVPEHPEYGHTVTREDGRYDLVVNGGGRVVLRFSQGGLLPVERKVLTPWRDFVEVPEVVLIPADAQATGVALSGASSASQLAVGSTVEDGDGPRKAAVLLPAGTRARMLLPDGSEQELDSASLRITEYTVGENGPKRMPARMPSNIAYTYAVELGLDEAPAGSQIIFDEPVVFYVDNFLQFPAGTVAPLGYYDSERAVWVPADSGWVIEVLAEADGLVELDSDGDGQADDATRLAELGIDEAEWITLSERFEPGDSFIRLRMKHFSSWDANWGFSPPSDAIGPYRTPSQGGDCNGCIESGSVIDVHNQILGEDLALAGLPFGLHYRSDRVPGRKIAYSLKIPLVGPEAPASLKGIELALQVAGQQHDWHFDADPDPTSQVDFHDFTWDGKDAYGRRLQGAHPVTVRIGYTYDGVMQANERFGYSGNGAEITASQTRQDITLWLEWKGSLGAADARPSGLGGWSLGVHHAYDPNGRILYRGDGGRRSADRLEPIVRTVAGGGTVDPKFASVGDLLAVDANIACEDVALGPDGSIYIASAHQVYRVDPEGLIHLVAGAAGPEPGSDGEGILATEAWISYVSSISLDRQGVLYFSSYTEDRVRKVTSDGRIWTVAGNLNEPGYTGDGGPAEEALLDEPVDILAASDGSLYIAEMNNCIIRRIGTDGLIHTVAGQVGVWSHEGPGDGGPAVDAVLDMQVDDLAEGPDGSIYFVELWAQRIRRIDLSGKISTVAGRGSETYENDGDGGPAIEAGIRYPHSMAIGRDGSLYISTQNTIRKVGPDGIITTIAGTGENGASGDGGPASQASFSIGEGMALDAEGTLYYADESSNDNRIRSITSPLPGFMDLADEIVLPSQSGMDVFLFDAQGRHLQTLHGLTGAVLWAFEYAEDGKLAAITDGDGNRTEIDGYNPSSFSIIPPFAQPTHIDVDDEGFIQSIMDPAGRVFGFTYLQEGLLTSMRDPKGQAHEFRYDSLGRLTRDEDPAGGFKEIRLDEDSLADGRIIELETAEGRVSNYRSERLSNGSWEKVNTFSGGLINRLVDKGGTTSELYLADGSRRDTQLGADPRLGMGAPLVTQQRLLTPAGLQLQMEQSREVESPSGAGLFDFDRITDTLTVNGKTSTSSYQASDRRITLTTPTGRQLTGLIDEQGRPLQAEIVDSGIWPVEQSYDEFGRLLEIAQGADVERRTSSIVYNERGFIDSVTDALGRVVAFERDEIGRVLAQTLPDGRVIQMAWDDNNNLIGVTPPGRPEHVMNYNSVDEMTEYDPPDIGLTDDMTRYAYNLDHQLTRVTRPDGPAVDLSYGDDGRLQSMQHADELVTVSHDHLGHVTAIETGIDEVLLEYEYDGPLLTGESLSGPFYGRVGRVYNNDLQVERLDVTNQSSIYYARDDDGLLVQAGDLALERDAISGLVTATTLGNLRTQQSANSFGELETYSAWYEDVLVYEVIYARDIGGRIIGKSETIQGVTKQLAYFYDMAGRLARVEDGGDIIEQYSYDENSNRLSASYASGESQEGSYDAQDRMLSYGSATYSYTDNGELNQKTEGGQISQYHYDAMGNLRTVDLPDGRHIEYLIDGRNRRVGKKIDGVLVQGFLYADQLNPVAELDGTGQIEKHFVYGNRINVPEYMQQNGRTLRIICDHLGSPRLVIDAWTGEVVQQMEHDAFGRSTEDSSPGFTPFGFAGGIDDGDIGLIRFGARDYVTYAGRWTVKDPIGFGGGDANLFGYVMGDPVNLIDPNGMDGRVLGSWSNNFSYVLPSEYAPLLLVPIVGIAVLAFGPQIMAFVVAAGPRLGYLVQRGCDKASRAVKAIDSNKLHHIFGPAKHNLGPLLERFGGSQEAAFRAVESATQNAVGAQGLSGVFTTTVQVAGQNVGVRGRVLDGIARVGSFWIP